MPIEKVAAYKYADRLYEDENGAKHQEAKDNLRELLERGSVGRGGEWDTEMFLKHLVDNFESYIRLLNKLY